MNVILSATMSGKRIVVLAARYPPPPPMDKGLCLTRRVLVGSQGAHLLESTLRMPLGNIRGNKHRTFPFEDTVNTKTRKFRTTIGSYNTLSGGIGCDVKGVSSPINRRCWREVDGTARFSTFFSAGMASSS